METLKKDEQEIKKKYYYQKKKDQTQRSKEMEDVKIKYYLNQ